MNKSKKFLWLIVTLLAVVALMPTRVAALEYHHARLLVDEDALVNQSQSTCLLYTSPSPRDQRGSRMPSSA